MPTPAPKVVHAESDEVTLNEAEKTEIASLILEQSHKEANTAKVLPVSNEAEQEESKEELPDEDSLKDRFILFSKKCTLCTHLYPEGGTQSPVDCHYSKGNEDCPARTTMFIIGVNVNTVAQAIIEANATADFGRLEKIYKRLSSKDESIRLQVTRRVQEISSR